MKARLAILPLIGMLAACQDATGPNPLSSRQVHAVSAAPLGGTDTAALASISGSGIQSIAVFGLQTPNPVTAGNNATYGTVAGNSLRVVFSGSLVGSCTVSLSASGLPAGATASFSPPELTGTAGQSAWTLLSVSTTAITPGGPTIIFSARATGTGGAGNACGSTDTDAAGAALTVVANLATTLTLAAPSPASVVFGSTGPVGLSATLTRASGGPAVAGATIAFLVDGTPAGSAVTNATGVASLTAYNPSALATGVHVVQASFAGGIVGGVTLAASTSLTQNLTISKAMASITWSNPSDIVYGTALSAVQLNATANVPGTFAYTPAAGVVLSAGNGQTLHVAFTPADATNFSAASSDVAINVLPKALEIRAASLSKTYGDAVQFTGSEFTTTGLVNGDGVTSVSLTSAGAAAGATVAGSPYAITPSAAVGAGLSNYATSYVSGQLMVTPAPMSVAADNKTRVEGGVNPPLTGSIAGIRNGDAIGATYSTSAQTLSPPGAYAIVPSLNDPNGRLGNYAVTSVNGTLTVLPNASPVLGPVAAPSDPVPVGTLITASATFTDVDVPESAPYTGIIDWGDGSATTLAYSAPGTIQSQHAYGAAGMYAVTITVRQDNLPAKQAARSYQYVVVYDRNAGFVTGGGWINLANGAATARGASGPRATFGFVVRYDRTRPVPQGSAEFQMHQGGDTFRATSFDWLVIDGAEARFMGSGTVNGRGDYAFVVVATDGDAPSAMFRIRIWDKTSGAVLYDTQAGDIATAVPAVHVSGGSIQIRRQ